MTKKIKANLNVVLFWPPAAGESGYKGPANAVSSENKVGKFDILAAHTNFISLVFNKLTITTLGNRKVDFSFKRGVLEVSEDSVRIFLGI